MVPGVQSADDDTGCPGVNRHGRAVILPVDDKLHRACRRLQGLVCADRGGERDGVAVDRRRSGIGGDDHRGGVALSGGRSIRRGVRCLAVPDIVGGAVEAVRVVGKPVKGGRGQVRVEQERLEGAAIGGHVDVVRGDTRSARVVLTAPLDCERGEARRRQRQYLTSRRSGVDGMQCRRRADRVVGVEVVQGLVCDLRVQATPAATRTQYDTCPSPVCSVLSLTAKKPAVASSGGSRV